MSGRGGPGLPAAGRPAGARPTRLRPAAARRGRPPGPVTLRPAAPADCRRVWLWRNDPATRRASFRSAPIPFDVHQRWYRDSLERADRKLYVVRVGGRGAGVVRLDVEAPAATVSIHLAPAWRGRGVGPAALRALEAVAFGRLGIERLLASVKADNRPSLSAFRKAGFEVSSGGAAASLVKMRRAPDRRRAGAR